MTRLAVQVWGEGEDVVLVHGSIATGEENWAPQRPLADAGFRLVVPDRWAYGPGAGEDEGEDFEADAGDVAELLGDGAHLVGHSYGGLAALLAAARRPEAVRSLAVIEPPAFALCPDDPAVAALRSDTEAVFARTDLDDRGFLLRFLAVVGAPVDELPAELVDRWAGQVGPLRRSRPVWEARIPLEDLAAAPFPKLVFSGGHHPAFDAVCAALAEGIGAERAVIEGAGHEVQEVAEPFNARLRALWSAAGPA